MGYVLDADIRAFFDTVSHDWLMRFLEHRIGDRRVLRLIGKWLKAGVLEDDTWTQGTVGTPQGAVISPLLANVYLHYVYDLRVQQWRKRHAHGDTIVIRYAASVSLASAKLTETRGTTRLSASSMRRTPAASSTIYGPGWQSLNWNCTLRKPV